MSGPVTTLAVTQLGVIEVTGTDAGDFLRAQLTNDVLRLGPDRHFLAAWCGPKGRTLAVMRVAEQAGRYLLILPRELIPAVVKRLQLYVLRARVSLADISDYYRFTGLTSGSLPAVNRTESDDDRLVLGLPPADDEGTRALAMMPRDTVPPPDGLAVDSDTWQLTAIDAGVPMIYSSTQDLFVPQMLNLHWLMAIDFDKGCFPGQEVVARLHYRGRLTRRLYRLSWSGDQPDIGTDISDTDGNRQGTVIRVASTGDGAGRLLAVIATKAVDTTTLTTTGSTLTPLELPYPTPEA